MPDLLFARLLPACLPALFLFGCSSVPKVEDFATVKEDVELQPLEDEKRWLVHKAEELDFSDFAAIHFTDIQVMADPGEELADLTAAEETELSARLLETFVRETEEILPVVAEPGPDVLSVRLTLVGVVASNQVLSTLSRVTPTSLAVNALKSAAEMPASFTGSVVVAGQAETADSDAPLYAFVAVEAPLAINITSGLSKLEAAKLGMDRAARRFAKEIAADRKGTAD